MPSSDSANDGVAVPPAVTQHERDPLDLHSLTTTTAATMFLPQPTSTAQPLRFLHYLPSTIALAAFQYVSLREKLIHLTHISRSGFPAVQPSAFACDGIELTPTMMQEWLQSSDLRRLLSHVGAVLLQERVPHTYPKNQSSPLLLSLLPTPLSAIADTAAVHSLASLQSFCGIHSLHLDELGSELPHDFLALIAASTPRLESLRLHFRTPNHDSTPVIRPPSFWHPLATFHSLRALVVMQPFSPHLQLQWPAFRFFCSLPLAYLDIASFELMSLSTDSALVEDGETEHQEQLTVASSWEVLRLPHCTTEVQARNVCDMLLERCAISVQPAERTCSLTVETVQRQAGLRYLGVDLRLWPDRWISCLPLMSSTLVSLELHRFNQSFSPLMLLDAGTARPLLPHLRHLRIDRRDVPRRNMTVDEADSHNHSFVQLLHSYRHQLRRITLSVPIGSACWPLLEAVFECSELRRCDVSIDFRLFVTHGGIDFEGIRAALRSYTELPSLPPLQHLHTLKLSLPLSGLELQRVLQACPALLELTVHQIHLLDAVQCTRVIAHHAAPTLRSLSMSAMLNLTADSHAAFSDIDSAEPLSHPPPFPALQSLKIQGHIPSFSGPALRRLVQLLRHAPLVDLDLIHAPLEQLHHLAPLRHLRALWTAASIDGFRDMGGQMPRECYAYFYPTTRTRMDHQPRFYGGQVELRRLLRLDRINEVIDNEACAVSDEQLAAHAEMGYSPMCRHMFVKERLFNERDGREAYMHALEQHNAEQPGQPPAAAN